MGHVKPIGGSVASQISVAGASCCMSLRRLNGLIEYVNIDESKLAPSVFQNAQLARQATSLTGLAAKAEVLEEFMKLQALRQR